MGRKQAECLLKLYWASNIRGKETQRYRETLAQWPHTHTHMQNDLHIIYSEFFTWPVERIDVIFAKMDGATPLAHCPANVTTNQKHANRREPTGTDGITCTFQPTVLSKSDWLKVWLTFFIPRQVEGAWNVDHRPGRSIWPAGVSVKRPVTEQAH